MRVFRWVVWFCLTVLLVILGSHGAIANMPAPVWLSGDRTGEPLVRAPQVEILHETLELDLRPLAQNQDGQIAVTYQIRNGGEAAIADLLFISPGIVGGQVRVNGKTVPATKIRRADVPLPWQSQLKLYEPPADGMNTIPSPDETYLRFQPTLPKGDFAIQVNYRVRPEVRDTWAVYQQYRVAYTLAPARSWSRFGDLAIAVLPPDGWVVQPSLRLRRQGDKLEARFLDIPADQFTVITHPVASSQAIGNYHLWQAGAILGSGAASLALAWVGARFSVRLLQQPVRQPFWRWVGVGVVAIALLLAVPTIVAILLSVAEQIGLQQFDTRHLSALWGGGAYRLLGLWVISSLALQAISLIALIAMVFVIRQRTFTGIIVKE